MTTGKSTTQAPSSSPSSQKQSTRTRERSISISISIITTTMFMFAAIILILCINGTASTTTSTTTTITNNNSASSSSPPVSPVSSSSPYKIVIDGGSTGSRLHIFEFFSDDNSSENNNNSNDSNNKTIIERRGSTRVNIPLSNFAKTKTENDNNNDNNNNDNDDTFDTNAALHLLPLFKYASTIIPPQYHSSTSISIQATAGMRLVSPQHQNELYDYIHETLLAHEEFVFDSFDRGDISTLDGVLEGLYGAIAVNYLKGVVDVHLHYNDNDGDGDDVNVNVNVNDGVNDRNDDVDKGDNNENEMEKADNQNLVCSNQNQNANQNQQTNTPFGALDMGGASMQIVYLPPTLKSSSSSSSSSSEQDCSLGGNSGSSSNSDMENNENENKSTREKLPSHEFFSTSYLSYGSDQFRERLWDTWIVDYEKGTSSSTEQQKQKEEEDEQAKIILNPCSFRGYQTEWKGYILLGTGDARECTREVNRLIPHHEEVYDFDNDNNENHNNGDYDNTNNNSKRERINVVGGIEHPPLSGEFYAMSLFFFVMDCVRTYTKDETLSRTWPKPSIHELTNAVEAFCSKHWQHDIIHVHGDTLHKYTRGEILSERCFESVYIITLLRDGFGFSSHSRDITYSFLVDGSEVEWSLGMAISLYAQEKEEERELLSSSSSSSISDTTRTNVLENVLIINNEGIKQDNSGPCKRNSKAVKSPSCDENITECVSNDDDSSKVKDKDFALRDILENGPLWS